ncbi:MAG: hypothetical protein HY841_00325 [Bacteroidetes bacterium]|nr:hypothetical protein [Bacteroidota bacterium]
MIKHIILTVLAGATFIFNSDLSAQCKVKPIVKMCMPQMAPFQYDSYVVKEITYGPKTKKETLDFQVFSDEEYKLVFGQTVLPQEVGITIYGMEKGKKKILYFDESGKKSSQMFNFGPTKSGTYYIEYEIPPSTAANQKGCFVVLIGIKE